jgi:hypothetical protein
MGHHHTHRQTQQHQHTPPPLGQVGVECSPQGKAEHQQDEITFRHGRLAAVKLTKISQVQQLELIRHTMIGVCER